MRDQWFEWDDTKAASSFVKHKVDFDTARVAFGDPNWIESDEPHPHEMRYKRTCIHDGRL